MSHPTVEITVMRDVQPHSRPDGTVKAYWDPNSKLQISHWVCIGCLHGIIHGLVEHEPHRRPCQFEAVPATHKDHPEAKTCIRCEALNIPCQAPLHVTLVKLGTLNRMIKMAYGTDEEIVAVMNTCSPSPTTSNAEATTSGKPQDAPNSREVQKFRADNLRGCLGMSMDLISLMRVMQRGDKEWPLHNGAVNEDDNPESKAMSLIHPVMTRFHSF